MLMDDVLKWVVVEFRAKQLLHPVTITGLNNPSGVAFDADGNLWVANNGTDNGTVVMFSPAQLVAGDTDDDTLSLR